MESIEDISLSKVYPFKNVDGKYCFINFNEISSKKLIINLNETEVAYDSTNGVVMLKKFNSLFTFLDKLKGTLVGLVYDKFIYNTSVT